MKEQKITIEIDANGGITADAEGFSGEACLKDLEKLLEGLGSWRDVQRKPEAGDQRAVRRGKRTVAAGKKS